MIREIKDLFVFLLLCFLCIKFKKEKRAQDIALIGSFVVILHYTLLHREINSVYGTHWFPFETYLWTLQNHSWAMLKQIIGNYFLFMPFGFCLGFFTKRWKQVLWIGFLLTLCIESCQLIFHMGWFETDDLIGNTLGTLIGYIFYQKCKKIINTIE